MDIFPLLALPHEVLTPIIELVTPAERRLVRLVCKDLCDVCDSPSLWKRGARSRFLSSTTDVPSTPACVVDTKDFDYRLMSRRISSLRMDVKFDKSEEESNIWDFSEVNGLSNSLKTTLTELYIQLSHSEDLRPFCLCKQITDMSLDFSCHPGEITSSETNDLKNTLIQFPRLTTLNLRSIKDKDTATCLSLVLSKLPHLKQLILDGWYIDRTTLRSLLASLQRPQSLHLVDMYILEDRSLEEDIEDSSFVFPLPGIKKLALDRVWPCRGYSEDLGLQLLQLTALESLTIYNPFRTQEPISALLRSTPMLSELYLRCYEEFDHQYASSFKRMDRLKVLSLCGFDFRRWKPLETMGEYVGKNLERLTLKYCSFGFDMKEWQWEYFQSLKVLEIIGEHEEEDHTEKLMSIAENLSQMPPNSALRLRKVILRESTMPEEECLKSLQSHLEVSCIDCW